MYKPSVFSYRFLRTFVQNVHSVNVVLAHLVGCAELSIGIRDSHHCRIIVPRKAISAITKRTQNELVLVCIEGENKLLLFKGQFTYVKKRNKHRYNMDSPFVT